MAGATERLGRGERLEGEGSQVVDQASALIAGAGEESRQGPVRDDPRRRGGAAERPDNARRIHACRAAGSPSRRAVSSAASTNPMASAATVKAL